MNEALVNFAKKYNYSIDDPDLLRRYRMIEDGKRDLALKIYAAIKNAEKRGVFFTKESIQELCEEYDINFGHEFDNHPSEKDYINFDDEFNNNPIVEQGKKEGYRIAYLDFAKKMKKEGMDIDLIAELTHLSAEEIAGLN